MKFNITGKRIRTVYIEIVEHLDFAEVEVSRKDVLETLGLPKVVDGDPTHWYGEVEEALQEGCEAKIKKSNDGSVVSTERTLNSPFKDEWIIDDLSWN
jgi:hypothetical protein